MPTLTFQHSILSQLQRRSGIEYDAEEWENRLPGIGCVVEVNDENGIEIEIFPLTKSHSAQLPWTAIQLGGSMLRALKIIFFKVWN